MLSQQRTVSVGLWRKTGFYSRAEEINGYTVNCAEKKRCQLIIEIDD